MGEAWGCVCQLKSSASVRAYDFLKVIACSAHRSSYIAELITRARLYTWFITTVVSGRESNIERWPILVLITRARLYTWFITTVVSGRESNIERWPILVLSAAKQALLFLPTTIQVELPLYSYSRGSNYSVSANSA